ncbi:MAG: AAC(3) family N-acetyltransferase [Anaerolineales bacterium]|nr:AAC(3) family N-acetyltransferase [Anaerolineales bacterium]
MQPVTQEQVVQILKDLGLQPGDGLLVHSALQFLGRPVGGVGMYLQAIAAVIGLEDGAEDQGTVAVPTFNFGFARGEPYDPQTTPSQGMGAFAEYVRLHAGGSEFRQARRTTHPMQSLAVIGRYADDLAGRDTLSAFDPGSAFERLFELDFKLLLLGADANAVSMTHYCEQRFKVPYRYWKDFSGQVRTASGWQERTYRMYVRDMELDPHLTLEPIQADLEANHLWRSLPLNYGKITVCRIADFVSTLDRLLGQDPWVLVKR